MGFLEKEVNRLIGKAIHTFGLLEDGDRIMVAVSGGADSLLTLWFLRRWQEKAPISFRLLPVYLDMGFGGGLLEAVRSHLEAEGLGYHVEETDYGPLAHSPFNREKSPCFLCSMLRRKRLFQLAGRLGMNKIAFGHNLDDAIETLFMNMLHAGELSTMMPKQPMFKGLITLIRPLILVEKEKAARLSRALGLPVAENPCPTAKSSRRSELRALLDALFDKAPGAKRSIAKALMNVRTDYLWRTRPGP